MRRRLRSILLNLNLVALFVVGGWIGALLCTLGLPLAPTPGVFAQRLAWPLAMLALLLLGVPAFSFRVLRRRPILWRDWREDPADLLPVSLVLALLMPAYVGWSEGQTLRVLLGLLVVGLFALSVMGLLRKLFPTEITHSHCCSNCGFDLRGAPSQRCPECGYTNWVLARWRKCWGLAWLMPAEAEFGKAYQAYFFGVGLWEFLQTQPSDAGDPGSHVSHDGSDVYWGEYLDSILLARAADLELFEPLNENHEPIRVWLARLDATETPQFVVVQDTLDHDPIEDQIVDPASLNKRPCPEVLEANKRASGH